MIKTIVLIGFLSFGVAFNSHASDSDRIAQLEKESNELKLRISKLERIIINLRESQKLAPSHDGRESVSNWRKLTTNMNTSNVRELLGEPQRLDGGNVANWYYENKGSVTFINGNVHSWREPR
jgi:hypothetical protein